MSIQESLYGPEPSESFDEACRFFTNFIISSNAFLESSILEINKILGKANSYRKTYIQNLEEAAEVAQMQKYLEEEYTIYLKKVNFLE